MTGTPSSSEKRRITRCCRGAPKTPDENSTRESACVYGPSQSSSPRTSEA